MGRIISIVAAALIIAAALVFTQFREMGDLLVRHLAERRELAVPFLHGGVSRAGRDASCLEGHPPCR